MDPARVAGRPARTGRVGRVDQRRNAEQILDAAGTLLAVDPEASMQAIADAAGLTRLTVYRHFSSRRELEESLLAAIDVRAEEILDGLPGWEEGALTLRSLIAALAGLITRYPIIMVRHQVEAGDRQSAIDARLSEILRQGQTAGVLRSDLQPDVLNGTLFAVLTAHARLRPGLSAADLAEGVASLLLHGLQQPRSAGTPSR